MPEAEVIRGCVDKGYKWLSVFSDKERALLRISRTEATIGRLEKRITDLRRLDLPTEVFEELLQDLRDILSLRRERLAQLSPPAVAYRCYLVVGDHIRGVQVLHCHEDAEAVIEAAKLLDSNSGVECVEIRTGKRILGRFPRPLN